MAKMWEYKIVVVDALYEGNLNAAGQEGWELVAIQSDLVVKSPTGETSDRKMGLIFKRPKE